jgi:hypothetical protein
VIVNLIASASVLAFTDEHAREKKAHNENAREAMILLYKWCEPSYMTFG